MNSISRSAARTIFVAAIMAAGLLTPAGSQQPPAIYRLPAPLVVDPVSGYDLPDGTEPAPRRGMVLHGVRYDALNGPDWATADLAEQAAACGDRLRLPPALVHASAGDQPVTSDFWLVFSAPEALYISRQTTLTALTDCVATADTRLEMSRLLFAGEMVTEFSFRSVGWMAQSTLPANRAYDYAGSQFLRPANMAAQRARRTVRVAPRQPEQRRLNQPEICFHDSGGMIYTTECRLNQRGRWHGLLLFRSVFHTETVDEGVFVDFLDTDTLIDGRLFEWDRAIMLAPAPR